MPSVEAAAGVSLMSGPLTTMAAPLRATWGPSAVSTSSRRPVPVQLPRDSNSCVFAIARTRPRNAVENSSSELLLPTIRGGERADGGQDVLDPVLQLVEQHLLMGFRLLALGDVDDRRDAASWPAVVGEQRRSRHQDIDPAAVGAHELAFKARDGLAGARRPV